MLVLATGLAGCASVVLIPRELPTRTVGGADVTGPYDAEDVRGIRIALDAYQAEFRARWAVPDSAAGAQGPGRSVFRVAPPAEALDQYRWRQSDSLTTSAADVATWVIDRTPITLYRLERDSTGWQVVEFGVSTYDPEGVESPTQFVPARVSGRLRTRD